MLKNYPKVFLLLVFLLGFFPFVSKAAPIIINHNSVDLYDDIPPQYMTAVKQMWFNMPGESHSRAYYNGLIALQAQNSNYKVSVSVNPGTGNIAGDGLAINYDVNNIYSVFGSLWNGSSWSGGAGESSWFLNGQSTPLGHITKVNGANYRPSIVGLGWCWDPGVTIAQWSQYIAATQGYSDHAKSLVNPKVHVVFTTGPVEGTTGESRATKYALVRDHVNNSSDEILFDYADILKCNNAGTCSVTEDIHPDNDGGTNAHIGTVGELRLAKAAWVLMARLVGWDGSTGGTQPCTNFTYSAWGACQNGTQTRTATGNPIGCVGGVSPEPISRSCYTLGGNITGLEAGNSVSLQNNGENLVRTSNGNFVFANKLINGDSYNVTVSVQPTGKFCYVENGSGNVSTNITNIAVSCCKTGDTDCSGVVNVQDIQNVIRVVLRLETDQEKMARANANGDGTVNIQDVQEIIRIVLAG